MTDVSSRIALQSGPAKHIYSGQAAMQAVSWLFKSSVAGAFIMLDSSKQGF